jgi:hypothetical protein
MEGDDPSRYEKFRGVKGAVPAAGGGLLELVWEF